MMSQAASAQIDYLTLDEYLADGEDTDTHYELVDGVLVEMPPESDENEDNIYIGTDPIQSRIVPHFALTPDAIFA
jgi:Uma2 family endonuclease